jgi:nitroreductase
VIRKVGIREQTFYRWKKKYGSVVIRNMMIAAHSLGLGSCFISRASETLDTDEGREITKD